MSFSNNSIKQKVRFICHISSNRLHNSIYLYIIIRLTVKLHIWIGTCVLGNNMEDMKGLLSHRKRNLHKNQEENGYLTYLDVK